MLIDEPAVFTEEDEVLAVKGGGKPAIRLEQGCYLLDHYGSNCFLIDSYSHNPDIYADQSGVCDSLEQVKSACSDLYDEKRQFVILLREVVRAEQHPTMGWRWRKWGPYIGNHRIRHEYLYDEDGIDRVFVYQILEKVR